MVFSSLPFLFGYLPLTLLAYFITPLRWRNAVLLVVSLIFYGWGRSTGTMTKRPGGSWPSR